MKQHILVRAALMCALSPTIAGCGEDPGAAPGTLIVHANILDGSGAPAYVGSVRIVGDRIAALGDLEATAQDLVVDANGSVLAPGFIDTHSHADDDLFEHPDALAAVSQGITTVVVGQDGASQFPLADLFARLEMEPSALNVASYAGFGTLRDEVLGDDFRRPATPSEIERMRALMRAEMEAGALGMGTGLEYDPGIYSTPEEVIAVAREAATYGGRYISHIRSEERFFWDAIDELLNIGRVTGMPVQISHIKLALRAERGKAAQLIEVLDEARVAGIDVSADIYPYTYWESDLTVLFPGRDFENREAAEFALTQVTTPEGAYLTLYEPDPSYVGMTLREIAALRGEDPAATLMALIRESQTFADKSQGEIRADDVTSVVAVSMQESDIEALMKWPHTNLCTDGSLVAGHPRGFGSYPRFLGRYVRERGIMDLATAVHKSSGLAAAHMGISDRGLIRPGMKADLVLFDAATVIDHATPDAPEALSEGIERVWINGEVVYADGLATGLVPGQVIRRETNPAAH